MATLTPEVVRFGADVQEKVATAIIAAAIKTAGRVKVITPHKS